MKNMRKLFYLGLVLGIAACTKVADLPFTNPVTQ